MSLVCRMSHVNWCTIMNVSWVSWCFHHAPSNIDSWHEPRFYYLSCPTPVGCKVPRHMMCPKHYFPRCSRACYDPINGNLTQVWPKKTLERIAKNTFFVQIFLRFSNQPRVPPDSPWRFLKCMCLCCFSCLIASKCFEYCTSFRMHPPCNQLSFNRKSIGIPPMPSQKKNTWHSSWCWVSLSRVPTSVLAPGRSSFHLSLSARQG